MAPGSETLSRRGFAYTTPPIPMSNYKEITPDTYDKDTNPNGYVNIGTSENLSMLPDIAAFVEKHPPQLRAYDFSYGEGPFGCLRLRKAMAQHMNRVHRVIVFEDSIPACASIRPELIPSRYFNPQKPVNPDDIFFANGCGSICEAIGYTLFDEGDALLISQPCYVGFPNDFLGKSRVNLSYVPFRGVDQFSLEAVDKYEEAFARATAAGVKVRAMLLCNPHNPLGRCYPVDTIAALMRFCNKHRIHLISDEIYALSLYDNTVSSPSAAADTTPPPFTSVLSLDYTRHIDPALLHVMYGLSKDFGASGLRLGCLVVPGNPALMDALCAVSQSGWPGISDQLTGAALLEDAAWVDAYRMLNSERLAARAALAKRALDEHGVSYDGRAYAGFFLWLDLRGWLPVTDDEGRAVKGWEAERVLDARFKAKKVLLTAGEGQTAEEPGFFRLVFTPQEHVLKEGLRRFFEVLDGK